MRTLDKIAIKYGTDKSSEHHNYTQWYENFIPNHKPISLLELGWGGHEDPHDGGQSALMWREWLHPHSVISVIDNEEKVLRPEHAQIHFRQGSQDDPQFLNSLAKDHGPFDVIVDDASHLSSLTIKSFQILWPHVKPGGLYIVEDTHSSYHDFWYGQEEANPDPDGSLPYGNQSAMQFLRRLADEANNDLFPEKFSRGYNVQWVFFTSDLCVVRKRT